MRLLTKLLKKLVFLALILTLMGYAVKYGYPLAMKAAGVPQVSSEESDLMSTVFDSAVKLVTGSAKKDDLARDLSDKLYSGRASSQEMAELGIEIVRPGASPSATRNTETSAAPVTGAAPQKNVASAPLPSGAKPSLDDLKKKVPLTLLGKLWERLREDRVELALIPAAFAGMIVVRKFRRKSSKMEDLLPDVLALQNSADSDPHEMQHAVHALGSEDFELLIALIYQRQGYRVSMSAGQSGGRGGDFTIARKAERLLVQCKKLACEHRIAVERVREFHEAMVTAGFTRGMYVASCGFSWDARHFAKTKGITLINARTLDQLLTAAREDPDENLLAVARWAPRLMQKVALTAALCPACDAAMDETEANGRPVWLCSQRPECRGRRSARKSWKTASDSPPAARAGTLQPKASRDARPTNATGAASEPTPAAQRSAPAKPVTSRRMNFQRLATQRVVAKPIISKTGPPVPAEEFVCLPATLKSVVPRKRPVPAASPVRDRFGGLPDQRSIGASSVPANDRKAADSASHSGAAGRARPEKRIESPSAGARNAAGPQHR